MARSLPHGHLHYLYHSHANDPSPHPDMDKHASREDWNDSRAPASICDGADEDRPTDVSSHLRTSTLKQNIKRRTPTSTPRQHSLSLDETATACSAQNSPKRGGTHLAIVLSVLVVLDDDRPLSRCRLDVLSKLEQSKLARQKYTNPEHHR